MDSGVIKAMTGGEHGASPQTTLFPEIFTPPHGPVPETRQFADLKEICAYIAKQIRELHEQEHYPLAEIAVIYTMRTPTMHPDAIAPELIGNALDRAGILYRWILEDYRAKQAYDVTTESVAVSTVHSVKGLDYACVFVVGLDWLAAGDRWTEEQIRKIAYVAVTRARERLFISRCLTQKSIMT